MKPTKNELRHKLKSGRLALSPVIRSTKSEVISKKLIGLVDWPSVTEVYTFKPMLKLGEVDINEAIKQLKMAYPHLRFYHSNKTARGWKITPSSKSTKHTNLDIAIVPMLGFDERLHRLGYGGGYYDRLLAGQPNTIKIGVCFDFAKVDKLPIEPHDIAMDLIVTEKKIYR